MTGIVLTSPDLFSVVTMGDSPSRFWRAVLGLPPQGDTHIPYTADTPGQRSLWAARVDEAVLRAPSPVLLVASGASCFAAAWWARLSPASYVSRVAGALLLVPGAHRLDPTLPERFDSPRTALPFPSALVDVDKPGRQEGSAAHLQQLAQGWGSGLVQIPAQERTPWQNARALALRLTAHIIDRRLRVADALGVVVED